MQLSTLLWTIYLTIMLFLTYDLIEDTIIRIKLVARGDDDSAFLHLILVSVMVAIWYMYYLH